MPERSGSASGRPVFLLGYDQRLSGGVTGVAASLMAELPRVRDFPILGAYGKPLRSFWYTALAFIRLPWRLLRERPRTAIVIVASPGDVWRTVPFLLLLLIARRNTVIQFHKDLVNILPPDGIASRLVLGLWRRIHRLVFLSKGLATTAKERFGLDSTAISVIPNGLDEEWLRYDAEPREKRRLDVAFFGRWSPEKGVDDLAEIFGTDRLGDRFSCHVYGANQERDIQSNLVFHGWANRDTVIDAIRHAVVVLLPSYAEAYPMVLLEATAVGTPFVSTSIAGIPDIATASGGGEVCAPGDVDGLQQALEALLQDEQRWARASDQGYRWAQSQTAAAMAGQWSELLADLET